MVSSPEALLAQSALGNRWMRATLVMLAIWAVPAAYLVGGNALSADLRALWVAGQFWLSGHPELVYPPDAPLFTMVAPAEWTAWLRDTLGYNKDVFPFLYPPIWAVLTAAVSGADFDAFAGVMLWVNAGLLSATVALAIRATGAALHPFVHGGLVVVAFSCSPVILVALAQGQPQILVSFLIVLAIERSRSDAQIAAGAALALAAAIKIYPAIYVVFWIARGQWRALAGFVVVGAGLAGLSVGLAGWELHRAFLDTVAQVGRTMLVTGASLNVDAVLSQLFLGDSLERVSVVVGRGNGEAQIFWFVAARSALWSTVENAALLAVLVGAAVLARRSSERILYGAIWPAALIVTALLSPIGWVYYLIPAAAFAPALIGLLRPTWGLAFWLAGTTALVSIFTDAVQDITLVPVPEPFFSVAGALVWFAGFVFAAMRRE